ncbi:MAG: tetratricopeptide repeat protein [Bdellovibrionaceae bacterium]|nr:tetratricopeptide repeat protein [Pseudobdellovibrionaceae bacterium]
MKTALLSALIISLLGLSQSTLALEPMDIDSTEQVIKKLERAIPLIKEDSVKGESLIGRLADLHAEQGRKKYLLEIEKNCKGCLGSLEDRNKAIGYYEKILKHSRNQRNKKIALFQMAHLYRLTGKDILAETLLKKAIKSAGKKDRDIKAEAHAGLVEIYYARGNFPTALKHANMALEYRELKRPGLTMYRKAWCLLNTGKNEEAKNTLATILKSEELLSIPTTNGPALDKSFQEDLSRDLALFLAREKVTSVEIELITSLSPTDKIYDNLFYMGQELSRQGSYISALLVWDYLLNSKQVTAAQQLEIKIRKAELYLIAGKPSSAVKSLEEASLHWQEKGCKDELDCESLRIRIKNVVINWHKQSSKKLSINLLKAYQAYSRAFLEDGDMHYRGAQVAHRLGKFDQAQKMFRLASLHAKDIKEKGPAFEAALVGEVESAEASKNLEAKQEAYEHYLKVNPNGNKAIEIHYQMAHLNNSKKKYMKAAKGFDLVATHKSKNYQTLKIKAADLAIDALVMENNHLLIENKATEYATIFKSKNKEFLGHARKASLNLVKITLDKVRPDKDEYKKALIRLNKISYVGITKNDRILIAKAKIKISHELQDLDGLIAGAKELYSISQLSEEDNEFALSQLSWGYELQLNFKEAYKYSTRMKLKNLSKDERDLWLAMLADFAGLDSKNHFKEYIATTKSLSQANNIRAKLILESNKPWNELNKELSSLRDSPLVLSTLALELNDKQKNENEIKKILQIKSLRDTPAGRHMSRKMFLKDYKSTVGNISKYKLLSQSQYLLKNSLITKMKLLDRLNVKANEAIASNDWFLQLITLEDVKNENDKLIKELLAIPLPKGLNKKDQAKYKSEVAKLIKPFEEKRDQVEVKTQSFWSNEAIFQELKSSYVSSSNVFRKHIKRELNVLLDYAPKSIKYKIKDILNSRIVHPTKSEIQSAWQKLKDMPFDIDPVSDLKELEEKRQEPLIVAYLDIRKAKLIQGDQR